MIVLYIILCIVITYGLNRLLLSMNDTLKEIFTLQGKINSENKERLNELYNHTRRIKEERKRNLIADAPSFHPKFLVERCIFEGIQLTIEEGGLLYRMQGSNGRTSR